MELNQGREASVSLLAWRSRRLRRKAGSSTMLRESIALSTALGALEKQAAMWESVTVSHCEVGARAEQLDSGGRRGTITVIASEKPLFNDAKAIAIVDAKSLFDSTATEQAQVRTTGHS